MEQGFFEKILIIVEFALLPMTKGTSSPRRIAGVSVRQESLRPPSIVGGDVSIPRKGPHVIPCGQHTSYCPQNFYNLRRTYK